MANNYAATCFHISNRKEIRDQWKQAYSSWGIPVPEMAFVQVKRQHIPEHMLGNNLNYFNLEKPLVGFKLIADVIEFMDTLSKSIGSSDLKKSWAGTSFRSPG